MAKILIVDDEKDVVGLIKFMLEKDGHQVLEAYNGREALIKVGLEPAEGGLTQETPELIILDIMMPVMDGYTVNTRLQQSESTRSIPVIVLTAKGQMRDLFEIAPNVSAYIEKPFDPKSLRERIKETLAKKAA